MRILPLALTLTFAIGVDGGRDARAQAANPGSATRVPATILLSDRLPAGSRFVVKRIPNSARHDVIVLASDATEQELGTAVRTLLIVRQREGDIPDAPKTLRIRPSSSSVETRTPYPWIARVLADVRGANPTDVPEVGNARAIQIWLPRQSKPRPGKPKPRT